METTLQKQIGIEEQLITYSSSRSLFEQTHIYGRGYFSMIQKTMKSCGTEKPIQIAYFEEIKHQYNKKKLSALEAINMLDTWLYQKIKGDKNFDWEKLLGNVGRNQIFHVIEVLGDSMPDEKYWLLLGNCYQNSDFAFENYDYQTSFLLSNRPKREMMMDEDERKFFDALPETVRIYRGCSLKEIESEEFRFSWSLKKDVAHFFAHEYMRNLETESDIVELTVPKSRLLAYFSGREEEEVIYVHQKTQKTLVNGG